MLSIDIDKETILADHLRSHRIPIRMSCGGHGSCKSCQVVIDGKATLSCQQKMSPGNYEVEIPLSRLQKQKIQIDKTTFSPLKPYLQKRWQLHTITLPSAEKFPGKSDLYRIQSSLPEDLQNTQWTTQAIQGINSENFEGKIYLETFDQEIISIGKTIPTSKYSIAVDIGTTTVSAVLIHLETGKIEESQGRLNAQYYYAEDLIARISFCKDKNRLKEMQDYILKETLIPMLTDMLNQKIIQSQNILSICISANAPMSHILLSYDPTGMGGYPFNGIDFSPSNHRASDFGLPGKYLEFCPAQSAYLGGDIISGLQHIDIESQDDKTLFIDLGTNAEMALKYNGEYFCSAAPAGPSFEGGGMSCGISAIPGAIDRVWESENGLMVSTIGNKTVKGLCGSGLISFIAAGFRSRLIRKTGRFARRHPAIKEITILQKKHKVYEFAPEIFISEEDISNFLQAKAAVFSCIVTLCKKAGLPLDEISHLYLAGNFGQHLQIKDVITIGLLPELDRNQIEVIGNTSLKGAYEMALYRNYDLKMKSLIDKITFIDLNSEPDFQDDFINALFLPNQDLQLFKKEQEKKELARI